MHETHQERWENAQDWMRRVNEAIAEGCLVFVRDIRITSPLYIEDGEILYREGNCTTRFFENDPEYDHGLHDSIAEFEATHVIQAYLPRPQTR